MCSCVVILFVFGYVVGGILCSIVCMCCVSVFGLWYLMMKLVGVLCRNVFSVFVFCMIGSVVNLGLKLIYDLGLLKCMLL